ncbi:DoxX family protein [Sphingobacterium sp. Mn56C]|uniref:DoxX family protein n=1 Tax=Sphingobacterium sp. Mn56C TaxID=3395261 RepID=UPI003BBD184F
MKTKKIIYWFFTGFFSLFMINSAYQYLTAAQIEAAFQHLGFPPYFRVELGIAKILGALVLLIPKIPKGIKQFAYAGFGINLISGSIAHGSKGDDIIYIFLPLLFLVILAVSYISYEKIYQYKNITN